MREDENPNAEMEFDIRNDPYNHMIRVVFGRWKPFILRALYVDTVNSFSNFTKQLPITKKVLSENLRDMMRDDLICRTVIPETPPRVEYRLTKKGKSLMPILDMVYDWGWNDMIERGLPIDALGEMWHGYREKDEKLMFQPFKGQIG